MLKEVFSKLFDSSIFNTWFSTLIVSISSIIAIPFIVMKLSLEEINVWLLSSTIVAICNCVLFGFNSTLTRFISYSYGGVNINEFRELKTKSRLCFKKDINNKEFADILHLMKNVYAFVSLFYFLLIVGMCFFFISKHVKLLPNYYEGIFAITLLVISTTISLYFGCYMNILNGINKVALVQRIIGIVNFLGFFIILFVVSFIPSLFSVIAVYQFVSTAQLLSIMYFAKNEIKQLELNSKPQKFNKKLFLIVWECAWKSGLTTVISSSVKHVSGIIVSQLFSSSVSASFLFTKKIFDILERFTIATFQSRLPVIARLRGQGNIKEFLVFLRHTQLITYSFFTASYILFLFFGNYLLSLLNSNVDLGSTTLIILFSFSLLLSRWSGMALSVSNQSNYVIEHIYSILLLLVFSSIIFFFHDIVGIYIFPLAQIIALILVSFFVIKNVYKVIFTSFLKYESTAFIPSLLVLCLVNAIYYYY